jgi:hypothetical protein
LLFNELTDEQAEIVPAFAAGGTAAYAAAQFIIV